jgi:hypothetical protein
VPQGCPNGGVLDDGRLSKTLILLEPAIGFEPMTCALRTPVQDKPQQSSDSEKTYACQPLTRDDLCFIMESVR